MAKTKWDYTELADAYLKRPQYSEDAIDEILSVTDVLPGTIACDVGAGVAHLTLLLTARGLNVVAVEPNQAMRANGKKRTEHLKNVSWHDGTGEATGQPTGKFGLVTFGSSFNVTDRSVALRETARILQKGGWFACMWNHRNLDDPLQGKIENVINTALPNYQYGNRREDQTEVIEASSLFGKVISFSRNVVHQQSDEECIEAWRSHATLQRQAGDKFFEIIEGIEKTVRQAGDVIRVPYTTRVWMAPVKDN